MPLMYSPVEIRPGKNVTVAGHGLTGQQWNQLECRWEGKTI